MICAVQGCNASVKCKGYCGRHYHKMVRYGDPEGGLSARQGEALEWLLASFEYDGDECQLYPFYRTKDGYGRLQIDGKNMFAARYVCERRHGPPPTPQHHSAHSCGNGGQGCVTKRHLSWKTPAGNIADKYEHGTMPVGSQHHRAKLTEDKVRQIRALRGVLTRKQMAKEFGVGRATIDNVLDGATWTHV